jgi:hypothetical protein
MRMPLAVLSSVALCGRDLSAATVLAAFVLVLGEITAADQPAETGNPGPALRWRVATSPSGDYVLALAVGKDGLIYWGSWIGTNVDVFAPDGALRRKLSVGTGTKALAVGKDGTVYAGTDDYTIVVFGPDGTRRGSFVVRKLSVRGGQIEALVAGDNGVAQVSSERMEIPRPRTRTDEFRQTRQRSKSVGSTCRGKFRHVPRKLQIKCVARPRNHGGRRANVQAFMVVGAGFDFLSLSRNHGAFGAALLGPSLRPPLFAMRGGPRATSSHLETAASGAVMRSRQSEQAVDILRPRL